MLPAAHEVMCCWSASGKGRAFLCTAEQCEGTANEGKVIEETGQSGSMG